MFRNMISIIIITLLFAVNVYSQAITDYGFKMGASVSKPIWRFDKESQDLSEITIGADVGFFVSWKLSEKLSLLTEGHYIQKGSKFYVAQDNPDNPYPGNGYDIILYKLTPNADYLSFPIQIKYDLLKSDVIPYIIAGIRVDFMLSKNRDFDSFFARSDIRKLDFGGSFGIGFQTKSLIGIGTGIELKYSPSFINVVSTDHWVNVTNRSFEISFILYN